MRQEYYNVVTEDSSPDGNYYQTKVLVKHSLQHIPSERHLYITESGMRRLKKFPVGIGTWYCAPPTPYYPRCIFEICDCDEVNE